MAYTRDGQFGVSLDVTLDLPLASVGSRALAQLIDFALLQVVQVLIASVGIAVLALVGIETAGTWALVAFVLVMFCVQWGWFAGWEIAWAGQTPGKRVLGLRVVADDGSAAGIVPILVRNLLRTVDFFPGGYFLGMVVMFLHPQCKRVGDLAAGMVVVAEGRASSAPTRRWPEGLAATDVRLVERYFAERESLRPARREELAAKLLARIGQRHPEVVRGLPDDPLEALERAFPKEG